MPVRIVVAVTDYDWFQHLRRQPDLMEVNFWSPSPKNFRALVPGEFFLFKLHAPINRIVGGGIFASAHVMPLGVAWEAFGHANGASTLSEMQDRILRYRRVVQAPPPIEIGCRLLTQPFFLPEDRWIEPPASWSPNIVSLKSFSTDDPDGRVLWDAVQSATESASFIRGFSEQAARYGKPMLIHPRLGQGTFRLMVTDNYERRCAVTGERTLPALEAAHIKPYADGGGHTPSNGILMRRDLHSLFDAGYVTISPQRHFEVSRRIKEEFDNGRHYYALHGSSIALPTHADLQPDIDALRWHNEHCYLG